MAIDLGRRRVRAVQGSLRRSGALPAVLQIHRVLVCEIPGDIPYDDAKALGQWLAGQLRAAGFRGRETTMSIGREHVGLKRIALPTIDDNELPGMTRLALQRELPFDADEAIIDFLPVERHEASTTVLAVAVPRSQVEFLTNVAAAAGLRLDRIALRTMGAAALLRGVNHPSARDIHVDDVSAGSDSIASGEAPIDPPAVPAVRHAVEVGNMPASAARSPPATLAIDVVGEGVEFCVLCDGAICFSRAAEVPAPQDELAMADAVVTEARRTWMSYRAGDVHRVIAEALIMGDRRVAEYAAERVSQMLRLPVKVLAEHPHVACDPEIDVRDLLRVWPLAGLLLEGATWSAGPRAHGLGTFPGRISGPARGGVIDFLRPRKAQDRAGQRRRRALLAACAVALVLGTGFTLARRDLQDLQDRSQRAVAQRDAGNAAYARYYRDLYKTEHLRQWAGVRVNWLEHAMFLAEVAPPPEQIVLDSWMGTLEFPGVAFDKATRRWSADHQATIVIEGEARNRSTADVFREALRQSPIYTASTSGADSAAGLGGKRMPFGFTYRLRTRASTPGASGETLSNEGSDRGGAASITTPAAGRALTADSNMPGSTHAANGDAHANGPGEEAQ